MVDNVIYIVNILGVLDIYLTRDVETMNALL